MTHTDTNDLSHEEGSLLEVERLSKFYPVGGAFAGRSRLRALHEVSFRIARGEVLAVVGESGSGKSTIARQLIRLERPDGGHFLFNGEDVLSKEPGRASLAFRGQVQMIFQDPFGSLNPVHTIMHHLSRPLLRHKRCQRGDVRERVVALLEEVGLQPGASFADRYPYELSGGQRQRVAIARALAVEPQLIIADEPTSMLDVSIRVDVLNLLNRLRLERGVSLLFITHDLASARYLADRIIVLYAGQIVEEGPTEALLRSPEHPYSQLLLAATPEASGSIDAPLPAKPGRPDLINLAVGCAFSARCPHALEICETSAPEMSSFAEGRTMRCHLNKRAPEQNPTLGGRGQ